jgi:hypothetical protein
VTNDPFPSYNSFRTQFFTNNSETTSNSTRKSHNTVLRFPSALSLSGISKRSARTGSSARSGLRNVYVPQEKASDQISNAASSGTPTSRKAFLTKHVTPSFTRGKKSGGRGSAKSESGLFREVKWWIKKLCMPQAKRRTAARVDLLE